MTNIQIGFLSWLTDISKCDTKESGVDVFSPGCRPTLSNKKNLAQVYAINLHVRINFKKGIVSNMSEN